MQHISGSIDRLLTYARGDTLSDAQLGALRNEQMEADGDATDLARRAVSAIRDAIDEMRKTPPDNYLEAREVGRKRLPTTVLGLLVHVAEHTQRHTGQIIATSSVVRSIA